jgi:L-2-hydroxyglutarate oxidase LhgO
METVDCIVVGAGVVGLAVARALAQRGLETLVLEDSRAIGTGISARNSEVIHSGIYYPNGSLKAQLCVRGRQLLLAYAAERGIPTRLCGKLIVATEAKQLGALGALLATGQRNGVEALTPLTATQAHRLEPLLHCVSALHSPGTGIVDSHALMQSLLADLEAAGGLLALGSPVVGGECHADGLLLQVGGAQPMELLARVVVNSAGLGAQALAASLRGLDAARLPPLYLAKGNYFALAGRAPFSRLVYPLPMPGGLGVHLTLDLAGQARFGPDVEWVDALDYQVDAERAGSFYASIRHYWPTLPDGALQPAYAGIRPKLSAAGMPAQDFVVQDASQHGVRGLVNLFGIESPGLTAALAIADYVAGRV